MQIEMQLENHLSLKSPQVTRRLMSRKSGPREQLIGNYRIGKKFLIQGKRLVMDHSERFMKPSI